MASDNKTKPTAVSAEEYLEWIEPEGRREDAKTIDRLMRRITGAAPEMWGPSIIGYGKSHYKYASGREGDSPLAAFAPRKANLVLYMEGLEAQPELMRRLGKHKTGKVCLYVNRLADIDLTVLEELIAKSVAHTRKTAPAQWR